MYSGHSVASIVFYEVDQLHDNRVDAIDINLVSSIDLDAKPTIVLLLIISLGCHIRWLCVFFSPFVMSDLKKGCVGE